MLVLSRKLDQRIRIGDDVEVVVLSIEGDQVKLGIQAPRQVLVLRSELLDDVRDENRRAAAAVAAPVRLGTFFRGT
ncbi:MAG: carbon storage regulator CsrA [Chloroflexota bacterium]